MNKNITGTRISRYHAVTIRPYPVARSIDMWDNINPGLRQQPDVIILYCQKNDIPNKISLLKKAKKLL